MVAYKNFLPLLAAAAPMLLKGAKALGSKVMGKATAQTQTQRELQSAGYPRPVVVRQPWLVDID